MSNTERKEFQKMEEKIEEIRARKVEAIRLNLDNWIRRIIWAKNRRQATKIFHNGKDYFYAIRDWESTFDPEGVQSIEADRAANDLWFSYKKEWLDK